MMGKPSILGWNNDKPQRTIPHAPGYALPETNINQGQEGLNNFYSMFAELFKESDRFHTCPAVSTTQHREEWTHHTHSVVSTDKEYSNLDDEYSMILPLIYP